MTKNESVYVYVTLIKDLKEQLGNIDEIGLFVSIFEIHELEHLFYNI